MPLYLAGPMRGKELFNFNRFEGVARTLRQQGNTVVSPHEIDQDEGFVTVERDAEGWFTSVELTDRFSIKAALRRDYAAVLASTGVVLLDGWEESDGANHERRVAIEAGIPCYTLGINAHRIVLERLRDDFMPPLRSLADQVVAELLNPDWRPTQYTEAWDASMAAPAVGLGESYGDWTGPGEVRVVDPSTGGAKGQKPARFDLLPYDALWALAEHFGRGGAKYEDRNWEKGVAWSLNAGAMQRHFAAWWQGEDTDSETGSSHMAAVAWHAVVLLAFELRGAGTDDRPANLAK